MPDSQAADHPIEVTAQEPDQSSGLPSDLASELLPEQTSNLPPNRPNGRPTFRPPDLPPVLSAVHPHAQAPARSAGHSIASLSELHPSEFYWLNDRQAQVLLLLLEEPSCIVSYADISLKTGIPSESVRKITTLLLKEDFITSRKQYRKGQFQGIQYTVNRTKCRGFFDARGGSYPICPPARTGDQTDCRPTCRPNPLSSSQSFKSLTANEGDLDWEYALSTDMNLRYWRRHDLRAGIVQGWIKKYNMKPLVMLESLKHADWDLRKREREAEERKARGEKDWVKDIVRKPIDWFHTPIKENGYYRRSTDYKSFEQEQLEIEAAILEEKRRQQQAQLMIRLEKGFQDMLANQDGGEYQYCYNQLPLFTRKRYNAGDDILIELLRGVYFKMHGVEIDPNRG
jgi:hypothetical protein